jgi:hypothetical protein
MRLIGILGKSLSGKTTVTNYIVNNYGWTEKAMADPLKELCKILFLLSDNQLTIEEEKERSDPRWYGCSPRTMYKYVGTELFRKQLNKIMPGIGEDVFVRHLDLWLNQKENVSKCIIISDCRFQNEVDYLKKIGAYIIKINRSSTDKKDKHESENIDSIKGYDIVIENDGSLQQLYSNIDKIILS